MVEKLSMSPYFEPVEEASSECINCGAKIPKKKGMNYCRSCFGNLQRGGILE